VGPGSLVVDAGCGTGRNARILTALGYRVIGVDRSPELIEQARGSGGWEYVVADLVEWRPPEPADAVVCRGVLNDLLGDGERAAALRSLGEMLCPGGVLIGDVRDRDRSAERYGEPRVSERTIESPRGELRFHSEMRLDGDELLADERIEIGGAEHAFTMRMRPWTREELTVGLEAAGFEAIELLDPAVAGARDDRIVFSARARA
jgi:glycine/sarcosine N-methyltransferase